MSILPPMPLSSAPASRASEPIEFAKGAVGLFRTVLDQTTLVAQYGPGEVFGEMSLIEERPHALTARAIGDVKAASLTRDEFERLLTTDPVTFRLYLKALFERLRNLSAPGDAIPLAEPVLHPGVTYVTIHPLTRRAAETLPDEGLLIPKFPFRIGRASDEHEREPLDLNDLWLLDRPPFNIARNHCVIDVRGHDVFIKDRGTATGLYVNELRIGGHLERRQTDLHMGDNVVILGSATSPYQFRIHVERG